MSDYKLKTLTRRIEEKLSKGYELVTKVKRDTSFGSQFSIGYGGQWQSNGFASSHKWKVAMRKINN
jgi:hypothetical protein